MNIYTSPRYKDDLYLITTEGNFTGLTNISFLTEDASIKEYEKWYSKTLDSVVPISDPSMTLQIIYISSINQITSISDLAKSELYETDLKEEDVFTPFTGGVKGYNFQNLCDFLWELKEKNHYNYLEVIRKYYKTLYSHIKI